MNRRKFLKLSSGVASGILTGAQNFLFHGCSAQRKPNIVFILVDDLSWADVGCYNKNTTYETPNIDKLSREGMLFTDFYAAGPVCSPTRASVLTGKYPARTGITTYLLEPDRDAKYISSQLNPEERTIAESFKDNGYSTGYFGKWHLGYESKHWAANQGFDTALGGMDLPWAWHLAHPDKEMPKLDRSKGHTRFFSPHHLTFMKNGPEGEYLTDRLTNETINFIQRNENQPFFAFLSFHTVHTPLQAKKDVVAKYKKKINELGLDAIEEENPGKKKHQNNPNYAAMVQHMDENVGRLLDKIREFEIEDNTIVVLTSDNGGKGSVTSNLPLNGAKHNLYEGGIRVPLIVKWPKRIKKDTRNSLPTISNDFYPTLLDLANCPLEPNYHIDGISLKKILLGNQKELDREAIYWHYPHNRMEGAVRMGDYKLIYFYKTGAVELYNLKEDIGEKDNISEKHPELSNKMLNMIKEWFKNVNARFPEDLTITE